MSVQADVVLDDEFDDEECIEPAVLEELVSQLKVRCKNSGMSFEEVSEDIGEDIYKFGFKCGRSQRFVSVWRPEYLVALASIPFEKYVFLADHEAICSYEDGYIEAGIRSAGPPSTIQGIQRALFGNPYIKMFSSEDRRIVVSAGNDSGLSIEISASSDEFKSLSQIHGSTTLSVKITGANVKRHDDALALLKKITGSLFFQVDLLLKIPFILRRERPRLSILRPRMKVNISLKDELQFPTSEYDEAPLSLYWYGRSAEEMPLLQFLAYYQVIEFYFPVYSQSEAQRKLKGILKNPTFRGDRDADVARLLSAIQISRSGAYGDERSQLRATLTECVDLEAVRAFIESEKDINELYVGGSKELSSKKITMGNKSIDIRSELADRIYDIRCKIVHTKTDARDEGGELLLPFSKEAELLSCDIKLIQYVAQQVLIAGSRHSSF